jgi:hypothetical protein
MNTRIALILFSIAITFLTACTVVIVLKLIFWPPCTMVGSACAIDGWSAAGLAGTVLGVSAGMLGILGAVAVAAWWLGLNKRVTKRVKKLFIKWQAELDKEVKAILEEKVKEINEQFRLFETKFQNIDQQTVVLDNKIKDTEQLANDIMLHTLDAALINPPWKVEMWASNTMRKFDMLEIPRRMCLVYLYYVDMLLAEDQFFIEELKRQNAPTIDPSDYWNDASRWQITVNDYYRNSYPARGQLPVDKREKWTEITLQLKEQLEIRKPRVDAWKQQHPQILYQRDHRPPQGQ